MENEKGERRMRKGNEKVERREGKGERGKENEKGVRSEEEK